MMVYFIGGRAHGQSADMPETRENLRLMYPNTDGHEYSLVAGIPENYPPAYAPVDEVWTNVRACAELDKLGVGPIAGTNK